jgi:transposase
LLKETPLSLKPVDLTPIPEETARIAKAAFPKGSVYLKLRDEFGALYEEEIFSDLFPERGCPAMSPGRLAMITIFQFAEGLSDRAAALDKAIMNLGTPPAMKIGGDRSMMTPSSVTEGRSRLGAINPR